MAKNHYYTDLDGLTRLKPDTDKKIRGREKHLRRHSMANSPRLVSISKEHGRQTKVKPKGPK